MCVLWKMFNTCMWMLKGIYAQNWLCLYMCVLYCSGQLAVEQKVSAWWAVWADFGIHREKQQRAKDTSQAGVQRCVRVWERMHVEVFTYCLSKYIIFNHKQLFSSLSSLCFISQMLWVVSNWNGHNGALRWLVVPCAGINLLSAPRTQQCPKVTFGLDLEPKLML